MLPLLGKPPRNCLLFPKRLSSSRKPGEKPGASQVAWESAQDRPLPKTASAFQMLCQTAERPGGESPAQGELQGPGRGPLRTAVNARALELMPAETQLPVSSRGPPQSAPTDHGRAGPRHGARGKDQALVSAGQEAGRWASHHRLLCCQPWDCVPCSTTLAASPSHPHTLADGLNTNTAIKSLKLQSL